MSDDRYQRYLFEYNFDGATWGFEIMAQSAEEAKERMKTLTWAKYQGEVKAKIHIPTDSFLLHWFYRIRAMLMKEPGR